MSSRPSGFVQAEWNAMCMRATDGGQGTNRSRDAMMLSETAPTVLLRTYGQLAARSPVERTALVLQLIEEHPEGRLELPTRDGAQAFLMGVRLGRARVRRHLAPGQDSSPWWSAETQGVDLRGADLHGANVSE